MIAFEVVGNPAPQGSKRAFMHNGKARMTEAGGTKHRDWRSAVAAAARDIAAHVDVDAPLTGALHVDVEFRFAMPASRPKAVRNLGVAPKVTAPDVDKLLRALLDGLTAGGLIADDRYVAEVSARKVEVVGWTGAIVTIGVVERGGS